MPPGAAADERAPIMLYAMPLAYAAADTRARCRVIVFDDDTSLMAQHAADIALMRLRFFSAAAAAAPSTDVTTAVDDARLFRYFTLMLFADTIAARERADADFAIAIAVCCALPYFRRHTLFRAPPCFAFDIFRY